MMAAIASPARNGFDRPGRDPSSGGSSKPQNISTELDVLIEARSIHGDMAKAERTGNELSYDRWRDKRVTDICQSVEDLMDGSIGVFGLQQFENAAIPCFLWRSDDEIATHLSQMFGERTEYRIVLDLPTEIEDVFNFSGMNRDPMVKVVLAEVQASI